MPDSQVEVARLENERAALSKELNRVQSDQRQARAQLAEDKKSLISLRNESAQHLTDYGKVEGKLADSPTKLEEARRKQALLSQALTNAHTELSFLKSGTD
jgi:chromosome segregation ATPase